LGAKPEAKQGELPKTGRATCSACILPLSPSIAEPRNSIRHSHSASEIAHKAEKAVILWFNQVLAKGSDVRAAAG